MRLLLVFFIGFLSFFYSAEILKRFIRVERYSLIGIIFTLSGLILGFFGQEILYGGLNVLAAFFLIGSGLGLIMHHLLSQRFILFREFEREFVLKHDNFVERMLEILPGGLTWLALTSPIWLSFTLPFAVAYLILIADIYWLLTALKIGILILIGYKEMTKAKSQKWLKKLNKDFPKVSEKFYQLILIPTYKEALYILAPTFNAITSCSYPKNKILVVVGFEERDDPDK